MYNSLSLRKRLVVDYAEKYGCKAIHKIWRDGMILQGRNIIQKRLSWNTLSPEDKELDRRIAYEIIMDWFTYMYGEPTEK